MKKIFFVLFIILLANISFAQYPVTQYIGADSTLVQSRGGFKGRLINTPFTDTIQANTQRVKDYPGAIIYTTSGDKLWLRNSTATAWLEQASSSSVNIYNSNGILTGDRELDGDGHYLRFNSLSEFGVGSDSVVFTLNNSVFRVYGLSTDDDTTTYKPLGYDPVTGKVVTRSSWVGGGGGTPTLQEVLATESNIAIIDNTDILPSTSGLDLVFGDAGSTLWNDIVLKGDGTVQMEAQTSTNSKSSLFGVTPDSVQINAYLGQINIDTLRSWSGISDTTYKKVMTWDTRNGRWEYSNWFGSGGGGGVTSIGTINSQTKSANGAVITGTSLVMQTVDATYPGLMTSADKLRLDSTSYLSIDKTFDSLAWGRNDSVFLVKSLRVQVNGSTITPTTTDSTLSYNLTSLTTSLTNGLTLSSGVGKLGGALTENTNITNATGYTFKLHLDEDDSDVGLIGDTYNSLIGFQNGNIAIYQNGGATTLSVTSTYASLQAASGGYNTELLVYRDKVQVNPHLGALYIDTLQSAVGTKALRYNPTTGLVSYADTTTGGGGSPAGNYGNLQLNRNGAFATPASDSLDFDAGLNIIGNLNASKFAWTGNSLYPTLTLSGSDPLIYFGGTGAAYPSFGAGSGSAAIYGSSGAKSISFYDQLISGKQMLRLYTSVGQTAAVFNKTVITVDTMVGGPSTGSIHAEASAGDSTSLSTGINTHMYRGIAKQYANTNAVNTFYGTVIYTNTNSGATGDHIVNWQSDAKKTGASTLDIIYHSAYLGDSIIAGIVNKRYGIKYWDAYLNTGAQLGSQMAFKTDKLKAAAGLNFHFLADSSHYAQLDGNILLGDSVVASSARKTLHIFNGTAPSASVANGVILYAEDVSSSSELKVRDEAGNITTLSPHNFSLIPGGKSEDMAWAFYSERDGKKVNVDMMKLARLVEKLTGEKLVYIQ